MVGLSICILFDMAQYIGSSILYRPTKTSMSVRSSSAIVCIQRGDNGSWPTCLI